MHLVKTCEIRLDPHGEMSKERRNRSTKSPYWNRKSSTTKKFSAGSLTWIFDGYTAAPARNTPGRGICLVS